MWLRLGPLAPAEYSVKAETRVEKKDFRVGVALDVLGTFAQDLGDLRQLIGIDEREHFFCASQLGGRKPDFAISIAGDGKD